MPFGEMASRFFRVDVFISNSTPFRLITHNLEGSIFIDSSLISRSLEKKFKARKENFLLKINKQLRFSKKKEHQTVTNAVRDPHPDRLNSDF